MAPISISRVPRQRIIAPLFPWMSVPTWGSLYAAGLDLHEAIQKAFLPTTQDTSFQSVFTTLTFQSLLPVSSLVCLISFLDLLSSWNSLLWLTHSFLFLASKSPTSEGFGIHWDSGTLPREPGSTDLEDWESDRFPQQVNSVHVLKWSVHILRSFGYRSTLFFFNFLNF